MPTDLLKMVLHSNGGSTRLSNTTPWINVLKPFRKSTEGNWMAPIGSRAAAFGHSCSHRGDRCHLLCPMQRSPAALASNSPPIYQGMSYAGAATGGPSLAWISWNPATASYALVACRRGERFRHSDVGRRYRSQSAGTIPGPQAQPRRISAGMR